MSLDFTKLKAAIADINGKFPETINPVDKTKNDLAQDFLTTVRNLSDDDAGKLDPDTILLYNHMVEHPEDCVEPTEAQPVTATPKEAAKARQKAPTRKDEPKTPARDIYAKFQGEVSNTARITMICCDQPDLTCAEVRAMLAAEGRTIARSTVDVEYANTHKVLAYLSMKGKLPDYKKTISEDKGK